MITAYSYRKHKSLDLVAAIKGGSITGISVAMFAIMGLPILVKLGIVLVLTTLLKNHLIDNKVIAEWLKTKIVEESISKAGSLFDFARSSYNFQT